MKVEQWPIDKVIPYENNPRKNDDAVEYVANSIKEFSFLQPIVVDGDGVVIVGHTRLEAAQQLGLTEVPVVVADGLTDDQAKAYRLADNKTGELAVWDWDKLNFELEDIDWLGINMADFGFKLDDELEEIPTDLDADETREDITLNVRFYSQKDYMECVDRIKDIVDGHGTVSVKMDDANN